MRKTLFILLFIFWALPLQAQPVAIDPIQDQNISEWPADHARFVEAYVPSKKDTLLLWFEHTEIDTKPDYESAEKADIVVWCHGNQWPHRNHIFGSRAGRVATARQGGILWVVREGTPSWGALNIRSSGSGHSNY